MHPDELWTLGHPFRLEPPEDVDDAQVERIRESHRAGPSEQVRGRGGR